MPLPGWAIIVLGAFALLGVVSIVNRALALYHDLHSGGSAPKADAAPAPVDPRDIEIDLHSTSGLVVLFTTVMPEIDLMLRVTNLSPYPLTVTHLTVTVWFGQPIVDLSLRLPFDVPQQETKYALLRTILQDSAKTRIEEFFAQPIYQQHAALEIAMAGTSPGGSFDRTEHIEVHTHDLKGVVR